jgi:FkbM family methyltransferase
MERASGLVACYQGVPCGPERAMKQAFKALAQTALSRLNIGITSYRHLEQLIANSGAGDDLELLLALPDKHSSLLLRYLRKSKSQLRQDLFVLSTLDFKREGFFVEFGATNGVDLSNTWLLEKEFSWTGILAEPARSWLQDLKRNRDCNIETDCVWSASNSVLSFNEIENKEFSTINSFNSADRHAKKRKHGISYDVHTISLLDLLDKYHAPKTIDYMSIDTEGSEYDILRGFDFKKYEFRVITCEHNFTPARHSIFSLLTENGYVRTLEKLSKFDDWYIKTT